MRARSEEDVRVWVSRCIEELILKPLGIMQVGKYEYTLISGARVDALYGHVVIEYKAPGKLSTQSDIQRAREQVIKYITQEAGNKAEYARYLGVIISDKIAFVKYDQRTDTWILRGPYDIRREAIVKFVEALRGLRRKPLDVEHLLSDFGPKSEVTIKLVRAFYDMIISLKDDSRAKLLFSDWMRLFRQATGYRPEELEELPKLASEYGIQGSVNYDALIFSIHTFYALLLKLIAAEITYLYGGGKFYRSYIAELDDAYSKGGLDELKRTLQELEGGGIFKRLLSIENFLEGDYFSWYLDVFDKNLADLIAELARQLSDYEIATPQLEPEFARDLLKRLYQNLVPSDLRHRLGEFYTPDWLANYLLDEVGLSFENLNKIGEEDPLKPLNIRVLDPACGSGTFLVLYISRLRRYAEEHYLTDMLLRYVLDNVVGFDLNPLAVLTARTNYLLAIADLLAYSTGTVEIPIYLADSIMIEKQGKMVGNVYILRTSAGDFEIPINIVKKGLLTNVLAEVTRGLENKYEAETFKKRLELSYKLNSGELNTLAELYKKLLKLEEEGKNRVWVAIIRNAFAPILKGKFDYVVGNPPWVNWENLPESYREASKELWDKYGLAEIRGKTGLGKVKRDLAMLFMVRCFDLYLKEGGKLGFLAPFTVFKTQAGAGFRNFLARKTKIHVIHDLVTLYPFEGAVNRTSAIVIEKICEIDPNKIPDNMKDALHKTFEENMKGVRHVIWINPSGKAIPTDKSLEDVLKETRRYEAIMIPLEPKKPESPWMQITPKVIEAVRKLLTGPQYYEAHAGVYVAFNQIYYIQIKGRTPDGKLIITNPPEPGQKKKVRQVEAIIEADLVYPLIRGRDVKKWYAEFKNRYIIIPHDPKTARPISENEIKIKLPLTYQYLYNYKNDLENRSIHKLWGKGNPFYSVYDIGTYTFAPYKVVWKYVAGAITGKASAFECAVIEPIDDKYLNVKVAIPHEKLMLIPLQSLEEAYYLCGLLNSVFIRSIVASYVIETQISTHILDIVKIPKFDPKNELHTRISELSRRAHELARCVYAGVKPDYCRGIDAEEELKKVEGELDLAVAQLFGLSRDDLSEFEKLMVILSGGGLPVEEVELPEEPKVSVLNTLLPPDVQSYIEVDVVNPSGEELEVVYEFPWSKGSFKIVEGKCRVDVPPLKPGKYGGVIRYCWGGVERVIDVNVEVSESPGPRRQRKLVLGDG
ncbi:MAG: class I SAM-dependent DNA methyltransferase [Candidatus Verstraetearchaeota archaeon]|nr:class I SAM-dependent DNA methyltransferase [Candidatus Verstraetearchaeota archaeon]